METRKQSATWLRHPSGSVVSREVARLLIGLMAWGGVLTPAQAGAPPLPASVVVAPPSAARAASQPARLVVPQPKPPVPRPAAVAPALPVEPAAVTVAAPLAPAAALLAAPSGFLPVRSLLRFPLMQLGQTLTRTHTFAAGWNFVSVPLQPGSSAPSAVFDELPAPLRIYDSVGGQWLDPSEAGFRNIAPGRTYWLLLGAAASVSVTGTPASVTGPFEIALQPGWNGIATPWLTAVEWSDARVSVRSGGVLRPLSQAIGEGWIDGDAAGFSPASEQDVPLTPNAADALMPWQGYRLFSHVAGALVFTAPPADTTPPVTSFDALVDGQVITEPTPIVGSVADPNLLEWRVERVPIDGGPATVIGSGQGEMVDETLATFDPTLLLNGQYSVRLVATDTSGFTMTRAVSVVVRDQMKVGHFSVSFVDLEVPLSGLRIQVTRSYDSRDKGRGDFGFGWRVDVNNMRLSENGTQGLSWEQTSSGGSFPTYCVQPTKAHVVTITLSNGQIYEFEPRLQQECRQFVPFTGGTVVYSPRAGTLGKLTPLDGSGVLFPGATGPVILLSDTSIDVFDPTRYELELPDGRKFQIHQQHGLQLVTDLNGNQLVFGPGGIFHNSGLGVTFVKDGEGRILEVVDPNGNRLRYGYDANGDLATFTDRENNVTKFHYHAALPHFLETIKDPFGRQPIRNEYDAQGRLTRHTDAFGKTIEYTHSIGTRQEIVKDRNDKVRVLEYDARGNVVKEVQPDGTVILRTFDSRNNR